MQNNKFNLSLTVAVAASMSACGPASNNYDWDDGYTQYADRDTAVCVDKRTNKRLPDRECDRRSGGSGAMWYYLGRNSAIPYHGDRVGGGTYVRPSGTSFYKAPSTTSISRSSAVSRGGFGSTGRSYSSFSSGS